MRLLTIVSDSCRGGATFSFINLILGLKEKGVDICVVTPRTGYLTDVLDENIIEYFVVPFDFSVWPLNQGRNIIKHLLKARIKERKAVDDVEKIAREFHPDIIHTNVSVINIGYRVAKRLKIPHVWHLREYGDKDFNLHIFPTRKCQLNKLKNSWSIAITRDLRDHFGANRRCKVIYNGIFSRNYTACYYPKAHHFLYVGSVTKNKGIEDLIKAFIVFSKENLDFELHVLGGISDEYRQYLQCLIKGSGVENKIIFYGSVLDVSERMQHAWAIVVPSFCEGFGRITAEAMFNNCLVIGRNTGGTKEQFDNGFKLTGKEIGVRFDSMDDLICSMRDVANYSQNEISSITSSARKVVVEMYCNEKNIDETYSYLNEVLNSL